MTTPCRSGPEVFVVDLRPSIGGSQIEGCRRLILVLAPVMLTFFFHGFAFYQFSNVMRRHHHSDTRIYIRHYPSEDIPLCLRLLGDVKVG